MCWCGCFLTAAPQDSFSLLKPSTLKQLGRSVPTTTAKQVNTRRQMHYTHQMCIYSLLFIYCVICLCCSLGFVCGSRWKPGCIFVGRRENEPPDIPAFQTATHRVQPCQYITFLCVFIWSLKLLPESLLFLDLCSVFHCGLFCRIWDCPQDEEEVAVRTNPATTCIRTDTNLQCVLSVAVS